MILLHYGGIDRTYGGLSIECADKILDLIDEYIEIIESLRGVKNDEKVDLFRIAEDKERRKNEEMD